MKKFVALFLALLMAFSVVAIAETKSPAASPEKPGTSSPSVKPEDGEKPGSSVVPSPGVPGGDSGNSGNVPSPGVPGGNGGSSNSPVASTTTKAMADIKLGQVLFAAHGTKCFAVMTVALEGDVIVAAYIDEFQFMDAATAIGVPNSDADFGTSFPEGKVLASKRVNSALYSENMAKSGSTVALEDNYKAIEKFVTGMTISELEATISTLTKEAAVDAVSGATLVDTLGYLQGLLAAAQSVK